MSTIYLFRHGQTEFNRDKKFTGWVDSKLTDLGRQQAQKIADPLATKTINYAYQTRLSRSQDTLEIVLKNHPECKEIFTDDRLIERSYGDLAGEAHREIIEGFGPSQYEHWHRGFYDTPPGGESFADVENRVMEFIADFKNRFGGQKLGFAISAHGNSIRLFRKIMENATIDETCSWTIPYDSYFEYNI
jgi:broad specificity phosphatase PhoE